MNENQEEMFLLLGCYKSQLSRFKPKLWLLQLLTNKLINISSLLESKNVQNILQDVTDPQFAPINLNVLSSYQFLNNFLEAANYTVSAIDMLQKNPNPAFWQVGQINTKAAELKNIFYVC